MNTRLLFKQPAAFVPPMMSLAALAIIAGHVVVFGATLQADEGAAAHLWQLLMVGQVPVIGFFLAKWLPRAPRPSLAILAGQTVAALAALIPVYFLHL